MDCIVILIVVLTYVTSIYKLYAPENIVHYQIKYLLVIVVQFTKYWC